MKELSLNILDIVQNSISADAKMIGIFISESEKNNSLKILITDDGHGISPDMIEKVTDPYTTSRKTRKVGLGLPFLKQHAQLAGGDLHIDSVNGKGTRVEAVFKLNHVDRQPMGDISGVIKLLILSNPEIEFVYEHNTDKGQYRLDTREIKEVLEVKSLTDNSLMSDVRDMILENLSEIGVIG